MGLDPISATILIMCGLYHIAYTGNLIVLQINNLHGRSRARTGANITGLSAWIFLVIFAIVEAT